MDRIGLGWRPELASSIFLNLDRIDVVEVILDDYFKVSTEKLRSLRTLSSQVPVVYHGVGLGLASSIKIDQTRLQSLNRVIDFVNPTMWSEHLAFVRAGNIEIGHLAAPPRNKQTIEGTLENLEIIKKTVGQAPALENIATLMKPSHSPLSESEWISAILANSNCDMLLDLNNLYANALNFGFEPISYLKTFPMDKVQLVHLSGGKWISEPQGTGKRFLDDHIHDVPDVVFDLLKVVGEKAVQPLTVIIERDGNYPEFSILLAQVERARRVLKEARQVRSFQNAGGYLECANS